MLVSVFLLCVCVVFLCAGAQARASLDARGPITVACALDDIRRPYAGCTDRVHRCIQRKDCGGGASTPQESSLGAFLPSSSRPAPPAPSSYGPPLSCVAGSEMALGGRGGPGVVGMDPPIRLEFMGWQCATIAFTPSFTPLGVRPCPSLTPASRRLHSSHLLAPPATLTRA
jgi:hypothetical protein